jgi:iron complex transport system substrate-binding protein
MSDSNPHYQEFESFKIKKVYSYALNKGAKGVFFISNGLPSGLGFKDFIKIFHPELVPNHTLFFFQKLE